MPRIDLLVKPDNTFLSQILYEGLLILIQHSSEARIDINSLELPHDVVRRVLKTYRDNDDLRGELNYIKIGFVGNDLRYHIGSTILSNIGIHIDRKIAIKKYVDVINHLLNNVEHVKDLVDDVLIYKISGGKLVIGRKYGEVIGAPQLFKIDRYTGLTSLDTDTTFKHFGTASTIQWILIGILGILSSYVTLAGFKREFSHYFLFLSPDEIVNMLGKGDQGYIYNVMVLKKKLIKRLREVLQRPVFDELLLLEILLDTSLVSELKKLDIDHLSFQLYRVVSEGQTYKIYNILPITLYSKPYYIDLLDRVARDRDGLLDSLRKALDTRGPILRAIYSFHTDNKYVEADHMVSAVRELYRLIISSEPDGLYGFLREIEASATVLENSRDERERGRAKQYRRILREISYYL